MSAEEPYKVFNGLSLQAVQELHAAVSSMQVTLACVSLTTDIYTDIHLYLVWTLSYTTET